MDQSAIQQIQQGYAGTVTAAIDSLQEATLSDSVPMALVPEGFKIQTLDVEQHEQHRRRFRGSFETNSLADFAEYSLNNVIEGTTCFVNADSMTAKTIINYGNRAKAGHCDDTAYIGIEKTAEYRSLLQRVQLLNKQKSLAEWLEEWADHIVCLDENSVAIDHAKAINSIRKITIEANATNQSETQSFREERSALESIEAKADASRPHFIKFTCKPYSDLDERQFFCRLSILTSEKEPTLKLRILREEKHAEQMAEEFKGRIEALFKGAIATYLATFSAL